MFIIGIISTFILILLSFSILGWGLKILGWIIDFLSEGCGTSFGCILWIIALAIGMMVII